MKNIYWLVRRELWEHKGSFVYTPIAIAVTLFVLPLIAICAVLIKTDSAQRLNIEKQIIDNVFNATDSSSAIEGLITFCTVPLLWIGSLVITFYLLGALFDDRKDKSVLFWKSLPISDQETVISKLITALIIGPVILAVAITLLFYGQALLIATLSYFLSDQLWAAFTSNRGLLISPLSFFALLPIQFLWALPSAGWLLLVSAAAKNKPLLWAIIIPLVAAILVAMGVQTRLLSNDLGPWLMDNVFIRSIASLVPGGWLFNTEIAPLQTRPRGLSTIVTQSYSILADTKIWFGAAIGCALTFAAIELRGSKTEL